MTRVQRVLPLLLALVFAVAACGGDDDDGEQSDTTTTAARPSTTLAPGDDGSAGAVSDPERPECQELRILLKLDVTAAQRKDIERKLESIEEVDTFRFEEAPAQSQESSSYHVRPKSLDQLQTIGSQIEQAGLQGVVSVIYPRQFC